MECVGLAVLSAIEYGCLTTGGSTFDVVRLSFYQNIENQTAKKASIRACTYVYLRNCNFRNSYISGFLFRKCFPCIVRQFP